MLHTMNSHGIWQPIPNAAWRIIQDPKSKEFHDLARQAGFHKLDLDDCGHARRLAKTIERPTYVFMVAKVLRYDDKTGHHAFDTADFFITANGLILVYAPPLDALVERVRQHLGGEAESNGFRLVHKLLDEMVDEYLRRLDAMGETIQRLESQTLKRPAPHTLAYIFQLKKTLGEFRRNATTMREAVHGLARSKAAQDQNEAVIYLHDVAEHLTQALEFTETYRDALSEALDLYLTVSANRTNDVMKVLALYGTIALPLVVITGFYGMNVRLPFAASSMAAGIIAIVMVVFAGGMLWYFRRRQWF